MKLKLLLLLAFVLTIAFTLFPHVSQEIFRIEAFGWQLETKQGVFVVFMLIVFFLIWFVQRLIAAVMAGPGKIWQTLRTGGQQRREQHLQTALHDYIDMRPKNGQRTFKKAQKLVPDWAKPLLDSLSLLPNQQADADLQQEPLHVAFTARIASDPEWKDKVDVSKRQAHLEAWLKVHPDAPLAQIRLLDIYLEKKSWQEVLDMLYAIKSQPLRSQAWIIDKKIEALLALSQEEGSDALACLQQAEKISPQHQDIVLARGHAHIQTNNPQAAEKLWLNYLKKHDDLSIAQATLSLMQGEGLAAFRRMEKIKGTQALLWLHACLAHAGKLEGLAEETLKPLLENNACPLFWQTWAQWSAQKGEHQRAFEAYEQAIQLQNNSL
ncbi:MAG: heme biosynthesis HemY N-terminal domain-containing protein [Mariprofundaceae bacterium]|nr:heme biosynthesis HemY N-terminal domain-containing protein [Mariprofundaceae bacterium]